MMRISIFVALLLTFFVGCIGTYFILTSRTTEEVSIPTNTEDGRVWVTYSSIVTATTTTHVSANGEPYSIAHSAGFSIAVPVREAYEAALESYPFQTSIEVQDSAVTFRAPVGTTDSEYNTFIALYLERNDTSDYTTQESCVMCQSYVKEVNTQGVTYYRYGEYRRGLNAQYQFPNIDDAATTLQITINSHKDYTDEEILRILNSVKKITETQSLTHD